ncbi:MAG: sulfite exporter TauE/SafE family protein [Chitinophagia bacterium]|nr:sulfite exporter TauE/SafE family protein [Chitinophagia bacterium]
MFKQLREQGKTVLSLKQYLQLTFSGVIAFIADTIGVGSFAVNIALAKALKTFEDEELPPMVNGAQIIPGALESIFFMKVVSVDITTLVVLVFGTCLGGLLGGHIVSRLSKQAIRFMMVCCFGLIMMLLLSKQMNWLPVGGELVALDSWKLVVGFFAMVICGALTSAGIGLFAMVQGVLFLLGVSPAVAFPIMTTAGAMQQPLTTLVFLKQRKIPLKKTLMVSMGGCIGVLVVIPFFSSISTSWLHNLLICILTYNILMIGRAFLKEHHQLKGYEFSAA